MHKIMKSVIKMKKTKKEKRKQTAPGVKILYSSIISAMPSN